MTPEDLFFTPIAQIGERYRSRELSPVDLVDALLARIGDVDTTLNSYLTVLEDRLRVEAKRAEQRLLTSREELPPLFGIPVSIKDNIATAGVRTTAGSPLLAEWIPESDAPSVKSLREAGALVVGKTNLFEFAYGEAHQDFGPVHNPWALDRSTAGSSTGSAAAVAAGLCWGSLATDTGGSIRVPAALCGVVGLKPTYGKVPTTGLVPTSWSMCHVGVISRTVEDSAWLFDAVAGENLAPSLAMDLAGVRLAVVSQPSERIDPEVRAAVNAAYECLEAAGADLRPVVLPDLLLVRAVLWTIASAEASDIHHERLMAHADRYQPAVRARLERGQAIPATVYVRAQRVRRWLIERVREALADADALLLPTSPVLAYPLGARIVLVDGHEEETGQAVTRYTPLASLTGRPAISVPCGFSSKGLPIGLQLVGHAGREDLLLRIAAAYEGLTEWHRRRPEAIKEREVECADHPVVARDT